MNSILDKYWEGNTTLKEEQELRDYFTSSEVAPEHEVYRSLFTAMEQEMVEVDFDFDAFAKVEPNTSKTPTLRHYLKGLAVAAGIAVLVAVGAVSYQNQQPDLGTYETPEEAYAATMEALELMSEKFNNGCNNLGSAAVIGEKTSEIFNIETK